jgi:hypothetical protein
MIEFASSRKQFTDEQKEKIRAVKKSDDGDATPDQARTIDVTAPDATA